MSRLCMFDKLKCAISIICLAVVLILVLGGQVLGGQVLVLVLVLVVRSLSWSLGVRSLSWSLGVRSLLTSLVKSDKCMGVSQLFGSTCPGSPPKSTPMRLTSTNIVLTAPSRPYLRVRGERVQPLKLFRSCYKSLKCITICSKWMENPRNPTQKLYPWTQ